MAEKTISVAIRAAQPSDTEDIARIANDSFSDKIECDQIRRILNLKQNYTCVATVSGQVVGFVDNFNTASASGELRLELDLLAVDRNARGLGAGKALIGQSIALARELNLSSVRALVAVSNRAMRRLCASCGFSQSSEDYQLYVSATCTGTCERQGSESAHLIVVDTLSYRGIWIEGTVNRAAIASAFSLGRQCECETVGAVVKSQDADAHTLLSALGFNLAGEFNWWSVNLQNELS